PGPNATGIIFTAPADSQNVEFFEWNLPPGFVITSGAGTNTITVSVPGQGAVIGNNQIVNVRAVNPCNSSVSQNFLVSLNSFAAVDAGPDFSMCFGNEQTLVNTLSGNANRIETWEIVSRPAGTTGNGEITGGTITNNVQAPYIFKP